MMKLLLVLALTSFSVSESSIIIDTVGQEVRILNEKIFALDTLLVLECPGYTREKREVTDPTHLEVAKITYSGLFAKLRECRRRKLKNPVPTTTRKPITKTTRKPIIKTTQKPVNKTTRKPVIKTTRKTVTIPRYCQTARNITGRWRTNYEGTDHRPDGAHSYNGYECDLYNSATWFRFSGAAGTRILNRCPKPQSCGTYMPYWTDEKMPDEVGVITTVEAYGSLNGKCVQYSRPIQVIRCSTRKNDFIYKAAIPLKQNTCREAFCGMK